MPITSEEEVSLVEAIKENIKALQIWRRNTIRELEGIENLIISNQLLVTFFEGPPVDDTRPN